MNRISITPIGSCRITNPLRSPFARRRGKLNLRRVYGFTHSSAEAVQLARFLREEFHPSPEIASLLFPAADPERLFSEKHAPSDLYFVEISSMKMIETGGALVQGNYFRRHFSALFSDTGVARRFWSLVRSGDEEHKRRFLEAQEAFSALSPEDRELLLSTRMRLTTQEDLERDMACLHDILPRVVFVTHCNARDGDGEWLKTRKRLTGMVKEAARRLAVEVYDPSELMERLGQDKTFTGEEDLTHYSGEFELAMIQEWNERYIVPLKLELGLDPEVDDDREEMRETLKEVEKAMRRQPPSRAEQIIQDALRRYPGNPELMSLYIQHYGEHGGSYEILRQAFLKLQRNDLVGEKEVCVFIRAARENAAWEDVLLAADALAVSDMMTVDAVRMRAEACEALGGKEEAARLWTEVYEASIPGGEDAARAACRAASCFALAGCRGEAKKWSELALAITPDRAEMAVLLASTLIPEGESGKLAECLRELVENHPRRAKEVLREALSAGLAVSISEALAPAMRDGKLDEDLAAMLPEMGDVWWERFLAARDKGDDLSATRYLRALVDTGTGGRKAQNAFKPYWTGLREQIRKNYGERDYAAVAQAAEKAEFMQPELAAVLPLIGKAFYHLEDYARAARWFRRAAALKPDDNATWIYLSRAASRMNDYSLAIKASRKAMETAPESDGGRDLREKMRVQIERLGVKALLHARALAGDENFDEAWDLAGLALESGGCEEKAQNLRTKIIRQMGKLLVTNFHDEAASAKLLFAESLLKKDGSNRHALKAKAQELMRLRRYEDAIPVWEAFAKTRSSPETALRQVAKCRNLISRARA